MKRTLLLTALSLALVAGLLGASCGSSGSSLCDRSRDCPFMWARGDLDTCEEDFNQWEKEAAAAGCSSQYDEMVGCWESMWTCENGGSSCDAETEAYADCAG